MTAADATRHPMRRLLSNRRGLLAGAAAATAGLLTRLGERVAMAAPFNADSNSGTTALTASSIGTGLAFAAVIGQSAPGSLGGARTTAYIHSNVANSRAMYVASTQGDSTAIEAIGATFGVHATALSGGLAAGVRALGGSSAIGLWADATSRAGVFGTSTGSIGVFGVTKAADANMTPAPGTVAGVAGQGFGRIGVYGLSDSSVGVRGESTSSIGVVGTSPTFYGVQGESTSGAGVFGLSNTGFGVYGYSFGTGGSAVGLYGVANSGEGLVGLTQTGIGVHGNAVQSGLAGRFDGKVVVNGTLTVTGGLTTSAIAAADGDYRRTYSQESPEPWLEDFGVATLEGGRAEVTLDPTLDAVVDGNAYLVFLTPEANCNGLYISRKGEHGFVVEELNGGRSTLPFSYRVVARRKDVAGKRLEHIPAANVNLGKDSPPPPAPHKVPDARPAPNGPTLRPDAHERPRP